MRKRQDCIKWKSFCLSYYKTIIICFCEIVTSRCIFAPLDCNKAAFTRHAFVCTGTLSAIDDDSIETSGCKGAGGENGGGISAGAKRFSR